MIALVEANKNSNLNPNASDAYRPSNAYWHKLWHADDHQGRRISKTITSSPLTGEDTGGGDTTVHSYKYDGWAVMEETIVRHSERSEEPLGDPSATPQDDEEVKIRYTYKDDNTPQAITLGDSTYYYLTDGHGDVRGKRNNRFDRKYARQIFI